MRSIKTLLLITWLSLVALACNLTSSSPPPTLVPRDPIAATAKSTLGYATEVPEALPQVTPFKPQNQADLTLFTLLNEVEPDRLIMHIDQMVSFHTRHVNSPLTLSDQGVGAAFRYINDQLQAIQAQAPQNFTLFPDGVPFRAEFNGKATEQRNAVAFIQGTEEGAGVILIGAHYDSRSDDLSDAEAYAPGASDNGSGVAALLEMARVLSQRPHRASIMFVFFAAEEVDAQGSRAFVRDYIQRHDIPLEYMINVDTIGSWNGPDGTINDRDIRVFSNGPNDSNSRQLARMANFIGYNHALDLNMLVQDKMDREGRYGDHRSFEEAGYAAIRFIEALEDTDKREGRDTIDGVEVGYLTAATRTILGVVSALADGPRPPQNVTLRQEDDGMQSLVWEPIPEATQYIVALRRPGSLIYDSQFAWNATRTNPWDKWNQYEAVAIAAVGADGMVGPFSTEYLIK